LIGGGRVGTVQAMDAARPAVLSPTASRCVMTQIVMPGHTNGPGGVLFGGVLMQWIDVCAGVAAMRHAGQPVVTASIDRLDFMVPVRVGDVAVLEAQVNFVHKTSMEVGCRVEVEDVKTRARRYTTKAYLTFVAIDPDGRPTLVPPLVLDGDDDRRRHDAAERRRHERLRAAGRPA
jgi:acyl-CoA hydrolase